MNLLTQDKLQIINLTLKKLLNYRYGENAFNSQPLSFNDLSKLGLKDWPTTVRLVDPGELSDHEVDLLFKDIFKVSINGNIQISDSSRALKIRQFEDRIKQLMQKIHSNSTNYGWEDLKLTYNISGWPENLSFKHPVAMDDYELEILIKNLDAIQLLKSSAFGLSRKQKLLKTISESIRLKLSMAIGKNIERVKWDKLKYYGVKNWPVNIPFENPKILSISELDTLHEALTVIGFDYCKTKPREAVRQGKTKLITCALNEKLSKLFGKSLQRVRWTNIAKYGLTGWPADIPVKNPRYLTDDQLDLIIDNIDHIDFPAEWMNLSSDDICDMEADATEALLSMQDSLSSSSD